jgi:hypothetical protein
MLESYGRSWETDTVKALNTTLRLLEGHLHEFQVNREILLRTKTCFRDIIMENRKGQHPEPKIVELSDDDSTE